MAAFNEEQGQLVAFVVSPTTATVRVLDRHGGFELVRDSQGREGWVAATDLAAVIPE